MKGAFIFACVVAGLVLPATAGTQSDPIFDATGIATGRGGVFSVEFEHIDPSTGSVVLTFTDLVLPGNAGRDLAFQRSYNSKDQSWTFGVAGIPLRVLDAWPSNLDAWPTFFTSDGGKQILATPLYPQVGQNVVEHLRVVVSDRFWKYDRQSRTLWLPDGSTSVYDASGHLMSVTDSFGVQILTMTWTPELVTLTQHVGATNREVRWSSMVGVYDGFGRPGTSAGVMTLEYGVTDRVWTFGNPVISPEGPTWAHEIVPGDPLSTFTVTTPHGGQVRYSFEEHSFTIGGIPPYTITTRVLAKRELLDGGDVVGTWNYTYADIPFFTPSTRTTIDASVGGVETTTVLDYVQLTNGNPNNSAAGSYPGRTFVLSKRTLSGASGELEREELGYTWLPIASSQSADALPAPSSRVITREGRTHTTTLAYNPLSPYGDFHTPYQVVETGDLTRTSARSFQHTVNAPHAHPYILRLPTSENVTVGAQTVSSSWAYELATGFRTSATSNGIVTTFTRDDFGNVRRITKANGTWMEFAYDGGQVAGETTSEPGYEITRVINPDGTVASETQAGDTTAFAYDDLGRLEIVDPPAGNNIVTAYASTTTTVTRGASPSISQVVTTLDGFGRPVRTEDAAGVKTRTSYDAEGRVVYRSLPFEGAFNGPTDIGTTITYDGLGRVTREEHADGTARTFAYSGTVTTATDENGRATVLTHQAFGHPEDRRLASQLDPDLKLWSYSYDTLGQLLQVSGPDAVTRTWVYDETLPTLLHSETHPESGTVAFPDYDAAGLLEAKQDARGTIFQYQYDGNERLRLLTAGSSVTAITYEPGTDRQQSVTVDGVTSAFTYDDDGRLAARTDTIDGKPFITAFAYDGNDNVTEITYPSGRKVAYAYGAENRLTRVFNPATQADYATSFQYHPSGATTGFTGGNGIATTLIYDPQRYWITDITAGEMDLEYRNYDAVGNVRTIHDTRPGTPFGTQTFTYDALDRLATAAGPYGSSTFTYDAHGNRQGAQFGYDPTNRFQLTSYDSLPMTYDANGNMITRSADAFTYTPANQVQSATVGSVTTSYAYDADAWRVKKTVGAGAPTYYVRGPSGQLLMEWTNTSPTAIVREYIYAGSRLIAVMKGDVPPK